LILILDWIVTHASNPIIMPQLGEAIAEATVISFSQSRRHRRSRSGRARSRNEQSSMNVSSRCRGRIEKWLVKQDVSYPVGAVLGYLEASKKMRRASALMFLSQVLARPRTRNGDADKAPSHHAVEPMVRGLPCPHMPRRELHVAANESADERTGLHAADLAASRAVARPGA
jgi:pyruvate/2-oxoglutarate dehydrogenase complex dihydrolipoamide acyltransferase (E2) component